MTIHDKHAELAAIIRADPRWPVVQSHDAAVDGTFFYSVKTTGVYFRPPCAAGPARPENAPFHATAADATRGDFRPCKSCKPDRPPLAEAYVAMVAAACRLIEQSEAISTTLEQLAAPSALSPFHFHRIFKAVAGVTPKQYVTANRRRGLRDELERSASMTSAFFDAGYTARSRFHETANQVLA